MIPEASQYLFVYGTLRDYPHSENRRLGGCKFYSRGRVQGQLYEISSYPGLVLTDVPNEWVIGEVFQMLRPNQTLREIDEYEGCGLLDTPPYEYQRQILPARLDSGEQVDAWAYIYQRPIQRFRRIRSGDYVAR